MSFALGQCPACQAVVYLTARGKLRRHAPAGLRNPHTPCSGSGLQVPAIERKPVAP